MSSVGGNFGYSVISCRQLTNEKQNFVFGLFSEEKNWYTISALASNILEDKACQFSTTLNVMIENVVFGSLRCFKAFFFPSRFSTTKSTHGRTTALSFLRFFGGILILYFLFLETCAVILTGVIWKNRNFSAENDALMNRIVYRFLRFVWIIELSLS